MLRSLRFRSPSGHQITASRLGPRVSLRLNRRDRTSLPVSTPLRRYAGRMSIEQRIASHNDPRPRSRGCTTVINEHILSELASAARTASRSAYCPYSNFPVGAAVLTESEEIISGCNVENASYGLTNCAERTAVFRAVVAGHRHILAVAIYTPTEHPTAPCGACRQVINEFGSDAQVVCVCNGPTTIRTTMPQLLPDAFGPHNL
jgi:cytidine deaminase